jgi:hypothetical protein
MLSIPLAAGVARRRACVLRQPDRHVFAANTGVALHLYADRGYAEVRWFDPARWLTALPANGEDLICRPVAFAAAP